MVQFEKRVLFMGYGAVAQCALPILLKLVDVSPRNVTVMDFEDRSDTIREWTAQGVQLGPGARHRGEHGHPARAST